MSLMRFYAKHYKILVFLWVLLSTIGCGNIALTGLKFYTNYELKYTAFLIIISGVIIFGLAILCKHYTREKSI